MTRTRIFLCSFASGLALFLSGCGRSQTNVEQGNAEQELYIGLGTEPEGLDPHIVTGVTEHYVLLALFEGLTTVHPETLAIEPGVALSWDISEDGLRYTFHLDPRARWSNGDPLTAEDFLFAYERILTPTMGAPYAYMLYCIRGAEAFNKGEQPDFAEVGLSSPDPQTLVIELEAPTPYLLSLPTHYTWFPLHKATVLAHGDMTDRISKWTKPGNFVGNGPFALQDWRLNHSIEVVKNPYYNAADAVRLNAIHFLPIDLDTEERAFRANQLHLTSTVPIPRIDWYRANQPERLHFDTYLGVYYYLINTEHGALKDARVRKALAYSIDRESLTEYVLKAGAKTCLSLHPAEHRRLHGRGQAPPTIPISLAAYWPKRAIPTVRASLNSSFSSIPANRTAPSPSPSNRCGKKSWASTSASTIKSGKSISPHVRHAISISSAPLGSAITSTPTPSSA